MASGAGRDPVSPYATNTYNKLKYFEIFPFLLLTSGGKKPIIYISKVVANTRERTMIKTIHSTDNAKMIQYANNTFKVIYNQFFGDDQYGMEFANMADAGDMFNMINMPEITAKELKDLGFTI